MADPLGELRKPAVGAAPADPEVGAPAGRQLEDLGHAPARDAPGGLLEHEANGGGDGAPGVDPSGAEVGCDDGRRVLVHRQRNRSPALERCERADDHIACRAAIQHDPGLRGHRDDPEAPALERRLAVWAVDRGLQLAELVLERSLVDPERRLHVAREEADAKALEAANGTEALALPLGRADRGGPVHLDAEALGRDREPLAARREDDGHLHELGRAPLQEPARRGGRKAADVDPGDVRAVRQPCGRAGERETDDQRRTAKHHDESDGPVQRRRREARAAPAISGRTD